MRGDLDVFEQNFEEAIFALEQYLAGRRLIGLELVIELVQAMARVPSDVKFEAAKCNGPVA